MTQYANVVVGRPVLLWSTVGGQYAEAVVLVWLLGGMLAASPLPNVTQCSHCSGVGQAHAVAFMGISKQC